MRPVTVLFEDRLDWPSSSSDQQAPHEVKPPAGGVVRRPERPLAVQCPARPHARGRQRDCALRAVRLRLCRPPGGGGPAANTPIPFPAASPRRRLCLHQRISPEPAGEEEKQAGRPRRSSSSLPTRRQCNSGICGGIPEDPCAGSLSLSPPSPAEHMISPFTAPFTRGESPPPLRRAAGDSGICGHC